MENISNKISKRMIYITKKLSVYIYPVIVIAGILLSVGILGEVFTNSSEIIKGISVFFYDLGLIASRIILPLISATIGLKLGKIYGLTAGLISGILISSGSVINNIPGEVRGASGFAGAVLVGFICGISGLISVKVQNKLKIKEKFAPLFIILVAIIGIVTSLIINSISLYLNTNLSYMLAGMSSVSKILVVLFLGFMVSADIGGPLYLSAYLFGSASIVTFESFYMVAVICAGTVGTLTFAVDNILDGKSNKDRVYSDLLIIPCLLGIPLGNVPFFLKNGFKGVFSSVIGSIVASVLSFAFNIECRLPIGGILSVATTADLLSCLNMFVAIFAGTVISTFTLRILKGAIVLGKISSVKPATGEIAV